MSVPKLSSYSILSMNIYNMNIIMPTLDVYL